MLQLALGMAFLVFFLVKSPLYRAGLKMQTEIPNQDRDDKKTRTQPCCHAELVSASREVFQRKVYRTSFRAQPGIHCFQAGFLLLQE